MVTSCITCSNVNGLSHLGINDLKVYQIAPYGYSDCGCDSGLGGLSGNPKQLQSALPLLLAGGILLYMMTGASLVRR